MAEILLSLRRHHFLYFSAHKRRDDMEIFLEEAKNEGTPCWQTENFSSSP